LAKAIEEGGDMPAATMRHEAAAAAGVRADWVEQVGFRCARGIEPPLVIVKQADARLPGDGKQAPERLGLCFVRSNAVIHAALLGLVAGEVRTRDGQ
jgi:hypothetical protein